MDKKKNVYFIYPFSKRLFTSAVSHCSDMIQFVLRCQNVIFPQFRFMNEVLSNGSVSSPWFKRIQHGNFSLEDKEVHGRIPFLGEEVLRSLSKDTVGELSENLCSAIHNQWAREANRIGKKARNVATSFIN